MAIKKAVSANYEQLTGKSRGKQGVLNFSDFQGESDHKRFDEMTDQTIYIVKLEPMFSDAYGAGYKVYFKDLPVAKQSYTAACFGTYVVPALENLYKLTHDGKMISLDSPVKTTIRKAGKTYRFE